MPGILKEAEIPETNPIRWVEEDSWLAGYNTDRPTDWFANQKPLGYLPSQYYQKFTFDMPLNVQIFLGGQYTAVVNILGPVPVYQFNRLQVYDCHKNLVAEIPYTASSQIWGNIKTVGSVPVTMKTFNWQTSFPALGVSKEGYYLLRLKIAYEYDGGIAYKYWVSEPIYLASEHPGTVLLYGVSYSNKLNSQFAAPFFDYYMRVEGCIETNAVKRFASGYTDQNQNPRQQSAIPYRQKIFNIGYPGNVPMYVMDKVNRALCNDVVTIDRVRYVVPEDTEIQVNNKNGKFDKYNGSVLLMEYDGNEASASSEKNPLILFSRNMSGDQPWYMVFSLAVSNSVSGTFKSIFTGYEITSKQDEDDFISAINGYWLRYAGMNGYITVIGDNMVYINGGGEYYDTSECVVFTKRVDMMYDQARGAGPLLLNLTIKGLKAAVVPYDHAQVFTLGYPGNATPISQIFNYTYPSFVSAARVRLWHDDHVDEILVGNAPTFYQVQPQAWPLGLKKLLFSVTSVDTFDLGAVDNTLEYLGIVNSKLVDVTSLNIKNWSVLRQIQLHHNNMTSATVDAVFNDFTASTTIPTTGSRMLNIKFQSPSATPTGASTTARAALVTATYPFLTD